MADSAETIQRTWRWLYALPLVVIAGLAFATGCAGPGPDLFPVAPHRVEQLADAAEERCYDTDGNGFEDYRERLAPSGQVILLRYDLNGDGQIDLEIDRRLDGSVGAGEEHRHLVILLDSVPFGMVHDLWQHGRFRLFAPPSRVISPFPVMTDLSLAELFGTSPSPAVESQFFDGNRLNSGFMTYAREDNAGWLPYVDYHLAFLAHGLAYIWPEAWFDHELGHIQRQFLASDGSSFVGYCVGPSALGALKGRSGHLAGLLHVDRLCQAIVHRTLGRVQITLLSDHGHNQARSKRVPLRRVLGSCGYRVTESLEAPGDVIVPEFGPVTCASLYTTSPRSVATDLTNVEGVQLTAYLDESDQVVVLTRDGEARIQAGPAGYRYSCTRGDPLKLAAILGELKRSGQETADGFVSDDVLFEATMDHPYPDAVHRLWRAFHGLIANQPQVVVSVEDGYHCGSAFMSELIDLAAAHGNLGEVSSSGFAMTTMGSLPRVVRMENLGQALRDLGIPMPPKPPEDRPPPAAH